MTKHLQLEQGKPATVPRVPAVLLLSLPVLMVVDADRVRGKTTLSKTPSVSEST
jgi:hypothetical protein